MLFNSYDFLFGFLPVVLLVHGALVRREQPRAAMGWLVVASLFFYGWWYAPYLLLLLASLAVNYRLGTAISGARTEDGSARAPLIVGIVFNLGLLGWFKYANFFADNVELLLGVDLGLPAVALPLAISFFTFQQIAYLVDTHRGLVEDHDPLDYALFVSFFPQLVAGPIVHHGEVLPQFASGRAPSASDRAVGATIFCIGLAKKVLVADSLASTVDAVYGLTATGRDPGFFPAWAGVFAYTFQLYFDFSGYSDMAIGLARMFGIKLPANFDAPYRADDIAQFWRRWHMTLSRFLRDYLYIPLGGNRAGTGRRLFNLFATMFLGGLWHGAGWTFVLWGGLHGVYLVIHQVWRMGAGGFGDSPTGRLAARGITLLAVILAWNLFRAEDLDDALRMYQGMVGMGGVGPVSPGLWLALLGLAAFTQLAPTTQRWLEDHEPVLWMRGADTVQVGPRWRWRPTSAWAIVVGLLALACVPLLERAEAFLYWNF